MMCTANSLNNQANIQNNNIEVQTKYYIDLIHELTDEGINFLGHNLKLINAEKYLDNTKCPICLEEYTDNDAICQLECRHIFHLICNDECKKRSDCCSICRQDNDNSTVFQSMSDYVSSLKLKCDKSSCLYISTKHDIDNSIALVDTVASFLPEDDSNSIYDILKLNKTIYKQNNNCISNKNKYNKKQLLLTALVNAFKNFDGLLPSLLSLTDNNLIENKTINEKNCISKNSCPYPERVFNDKNPTNFLEQYHSIICKYIGDIITSSLSFSNKIINYEYSYNSKLKKIFLKVYINDNQSITTEFSNNEIIEKSTTAMKCWYNIYKMSSNFIKFCIIILEFPKLSDKNKTLYLQGISSADGKLLFKYKNKDIYLNFEEFSSVDNLNFDLTKFKLALERNGINIDDL